MFSFNISYPDLINFLYFADASDLKLKEGLGLGGERKPKDRVKTGWLYGSLYCNNSSWEISNGSFDKHFYLMFVDKNWKRNLWCHITSPYLATRVLKNWCGLLACKALCSSKLSPKKGSPNWPGGKGAFFCMSDFICK